MARTSRFSNVTGATSATLYLLVTLLTLTLTLTPVSGGKRGKVLLVSMDGFRHDYLTKANTPNFDAMIRAGVTMPYLNNTFVTNTFPNHYTLATGLYTESHGIVANHMYDPDFDAFFNPGNSEPRWWDGGEPIWITAVKAGLKAGTFFWPGSEVEIQGLRPTEWRPYDESVPFLLRVNTTVDWLESGFDLGVLYMHEPDKSGHRVGPDSPNLVPVIERMDNVLGHIIEQLELRGIKDEVNLIVTSDHGMTNVDLDKKLIDVTDYANSSLLLSVVDQGSTAEIRAQVNKSRELQAALSGVEHMQVWLKEDIPERFHLKHNRRVMDVFALADEGWSITDNATRRRARPYVGDHGYDNYLPNMKPFFIAMGPAFKSGKTVEPISNLDVYSLVCHLLDITPAPNNGSLDRASPLLQSPGAAASHTLTTLLLSSALATFWATVYDL
ncbi:ectonucleotide pyrophosphatase/phosphodiesterase family member 5 [Aplysia californica]|uniref:Ectonucleotide pyrophosphatase/phosphodiesterase family member 5 n=1 Tax=Aplysia californica TaxID=6500 RepID=A0ABM1A7E5_APLCA|nr:ectonucleotide pyrophosphatase/phosphodiesterase family member 5 [Aplysia californica]